MRKLILLLMCVLALSLVPTPVHAEVQEENLLDNIVREYRDKSQNWVPIIRTHAIRLFWLLAVLELTWTGIRLGLSNTDVGEVLAEITRHVLFIGFGYTLLTYSSDWAFTIVNSFRSLADLASASGGGTMGVSPSAIFEIGYIMVNKIGGTLTLWNPAESLGLVIAGIVILACFAFMAALLLLALVETYIVINAGVILLAFGGSRFTNDIAKKYFFYAISVGLKLFVMQLLVGLGETLMRGWLANFEVNNPQIWLMMGSSVVMLALVHQIPTILASLISGSNFSTGDSLVKGGMTAAAAMVGGAAGAAAPAALKAMSKFSSPTGFSSGFGGAPFGAGFSGKTSGFASNSNLFSNKSGMNGIAGFMKPPLTGPPKFGASVSPQPGGGNNGPDFSVSFMKGGK